MVHKINLNQQKTISKFTRRHGFHKIKVTPRREVWETPRGTKFIFYKEKGKIHPNFPAPDDVAYLIEALPKKFTTGIEVHFLTRDRASQKAVARKTKRYRFKTITKKERHKEVRKEREDLRRTNARYIPKGYMAPAQIQVFPSFRPFDELRREFLHELGHSIYYRFSRIMNNWNASMNKLSSPTPYGGSKTSEDFAESFERYMLGKSLRPWLSDVSDESKKREKFFKKYLKRLYKNRA